MTQKELLTTIERQKEEIKQLEEDLSFVHHEISKEIIQREISVTKHTLKQYVTMIK